MPTYTVVSDIHANYPALEAVLEDAPETDGLLCLGDLIGLGGFPSAVVECLREQGTYCLQGNHDLSVIEWGEGHVNSTELSMFELNTTLDHLDFEQQMWVNDLPAYLELKDVGLLLAHAKPTPESASGLERGNAGLPAKHFVEAGARAPDWVEIMLVGHTHHQHVVDMADYDGDHQTIVTNPGSVGQPITGNPEYAIIDTDDATVELRETTYDVEDTIERLRELEVPIKWWH